MNLVTFLAEHPPVNLTAAPFPGEGTLVGGYYEISSHIPDKEITRLNITISYNSADLQGAGIDESTLHILSYNENGTWMQLAPGGIDTVNKKVLGQTNHTGLFVIRSSG